MAIRVIADAHSWDEDGCCTHCGFDGAEFWHWKHMTHEGKAQPEVKEPACINPADFSLQPVEFYSPKE